MGSGVAALLRQRYPKVWSDYSSHAERQGLRMGEIIWSINDPHVVLNAITQNNYGRDSSIRYASYDAIAEAFEVLNLEARLTQIDPDHAEARGGVINEVAMPLIGAGLANGSWKIISTIIEAEAQDFQPVVYLLDGVIPTS